MWEAAETCTGGFRRCHSREADRTCRKSPEAAQAASRGGEMARSDHAGLSLAELLQPVPRFAVHVSKMLIAQALWDYGEDELWGRALQMTDADHIKIERICAWYEAADYPLPLVGQRITHHHVNALAAITLFEGRVRPLARTRRRPEKGRPRELLDPASPE